MEGLYFWLASISTFFIVLTILHALPKIKTSDIGEVGSFISGIISPLALLWVIYAQIEQSKIIELERKISQNKVEKLSPYLTLQAQTIAFDSYKNYKEIREKILIHRYPDQIKKIEINSSEYDDYKNQELINLENLIKFSISEDSKKEREDLDTLIKAYNDFEKYSFEKSPYKDGSHKININIENIGEKIENIYINQKDRSNITYTTPTNKKLNQNEELTFNVIAPISYLSKENIIIFLHGTDNKKQNRTYKIEIKLSREAKNTMEYIKNEYTLKTDNENLIYILSFERFNASLEYKINEIRHE